MSDGKFDPHRRLCPDGACIGIIGDDGRCRVCGRAAGGGGKDAAPPEGFVPATDADVDEDDDSFDDHHDHANEGAATEQKQAGAGGFDATRKLCPDGSCIGVIGADGVCTVCGQKAD